jgi:hypothetical protein
VLTASLVSTAVPGAWRGHVHSVFAHAVNVACGDRLVTLADQTIGGLPSGVTLDEKANFRDLELLPGTRVGVDGGVVHVEGSTLWVDLRFAVRWSPLLGCRGSMPEGRRGLVEPALRRAGSRGLKGRFAPALWALIDGQNAAPAWFILLDEALRTCDAATTHAACFALIGLGEGLTPSGDDVLVGLSAALRGGGHPHAQEFAAVAAHLAPGRTTDVATAFLIHAARGEYSQRIHSLIEALWTGHELEAAIAATLDWGGTSGADTLLGVLLGCGVLRA